MKINRENSILSEDQKRQLGVVDNRLDFYFKVENSVIDGYESEEINPKTNKVEIVEKSYFDNVYELVVYTALSRYCNNGQVAFPSIQTLAKRCCCGQTSIKNAIKGLEQKGFIKKINRKKANSAENDTNIYAIKNIEQIVNVGRVATDVGRDTTEGVGRETTGKKNNILNNNNISNKKIDTSAEAESLDQEKIKFRENINKYISKVEEVTGKNKEEISRVINPSLMKNYDIELLLKKIDESKFLSGKTETKPKINNFCSKTMIDKILIGFYEDRETKKIQKNLKQKIEKEQYSGEWW